MSLREEIETAIDDWLQDVTQTVDFVEQYMDDPEELDSPMDEQWGAISSRILLLLKGELLRARKSELETIPPFKTAKQYVECIDNRISGLESLTKEV